MHPPAPVLQIDSLSFGHPGSPNGLLFDQLAVCLRPGVTLLCGPESSGKTTLLQLLAGAYPLPAALARQFHINGQCLADTPSAYRQQVAWFDPRDPALDAHPARQLFATLARRHPGFDPLALQAHTDGLSLQAHLDKPLCQLSTGTRRKVLMAAALASQAPLTLLDQPFMALDYPSIDYLRGLLGQALRHPRRAWVMADYEAPSHLALTDVLVLGQGR